MTSMPAPISIAAAHCWLMIIMTSRGMQAASSSNSIQRVVRIMVRGSECMNQSRNLATVASTERPSTTALITTM